jgi:metal-dependent amidase/aminoacylase/carboxypeptidase family protein
LAAAFADHVRAHEQISVTAAPPTMGAEDFAYFAARVPGVLVRLGMRNEAVGAVHYVHSPQFRLDESAIPVGIRTLVTFARGVGAGEIPVS